MASTNGGQNAKDASLDIAREIPGGTHLTTDQGVGVTHTDNSIKAGPRGPILLEDFHLREKITRFDHERIPERVVHARGSGAHGIFQVYRPLTEWTKAAFLQNPEERTPVFVRFSTVGGSRGSADTVRDVRGFATKFYTKDGNYDLVGNNMPVFFIQDGIKFPDFVHAVKPEPHNEIPQASSAHDSLWDFVSLVPETSHMIMWLMSDRALPVRYSMMEGFGVHTFRLVNAEGKTRLVKFHWKPRLGAHSLAWDETQKIAGKDPDFNRRDLWESIESGNYPEYELGFQVVEEEDVLKYGFDMLDPTKLLPEELVPVEIVGKMTLNRNPDNFFAEVEQVAFDAGNIVPGIELSEDPLLQVRTFSYIDTQLTRLGGPNFAEIPINRPLTGIHNHQQDGFMRQTINTNRANYFPNSLGDGEPPLASPERGYVPYPAPIEGPRKTRERAETFLDFFSQARLFLNSQSAPERAHLTEALQFELGKVTRMEIRERVVNRILAAIDIDLARDVALAIGVEPPAAAPDVPAFKQPIEASPALSLANTRKDSIVGRKVAIVLEAGFDGVSASAAASVLAAGGATAAFVSSRLGTVEPASGQAVEAEYTFLTTSSVLFDAVFIPGGRESVNRLSGQEAVLEFVRDAYRHCKPIGATGEAVDLLSRGGFGDLPLDRPGSAMADVAAGIVVAAEGGEEQASQFARAVAQHRFWQRQQRIAPGTNSAAAGAF